MKKRLGPCELQKMLFHAGVYLYISLFLSAIAAKAQPVRRPLEVVSAADLRQRYTGKTELTNNVDFIKDLLSGKRDFSIRIVLSTETSRSRETISRQTRDYGKPIYANPPHFHINSSSSQFLVEELSCPPDSYSLNTWDPV